MSYANEDGEVGVGSGAAYTHDHNTWDLSVTLDEDDFVSLDIAQLKQPRRPDGSLPDITFGHLAADSDLIDAGTIIADLHCETAREHPGAGCVEWYGSAPDLGSFEYRE